MLLVAGAVLPANAGTSIPATYNGGSHISYKFYASTNTFCIKKYEIHDSSAQVSFEFDGDRRYVIHTSLPDNWKCGVLTDHGMREGQRIKFTLAMYWNSEIQHSRSSGYVYI